MGIHATWNPEASLKSPMSAITRAEAKRSRRAGDIFKVKARKNPRKKKNGRLYQRTRASSSRSMCLEKYR